MSEPSVQKSMQHLLTQPETSKDHLSMVAKALLYGTERAKLKHKQRPYSSELAKALVLAAIPIDSEELFFLLRKYLLAINTQDSLLLLQILRTTYFDQKEKYTNTSRHRRGKTWDEKNSVYDLVSPLAQRKYDVKMYPNRRSYIWGKKFGGRDISAQVAAGGFVGANTSGSYKLFGHAIAKATCYDYSLTFLEFLILHTKDSQSTVSQLYANVMGITLKNINKKEGPNACNSIEVPLYEGKEYTIFEFTYSVFVDVGTLDFHLTATVQFTTGMYIEFCDKVGSKVTVGAGLSPTLTMVVSATGDLEIAVRDTTL